MSNITKVRVPRRPARRTIKPRTPNAGSMTHPRKVTIRMTVEDSSRLMQLQGLAKKFGNKDLVQIWHDTLLPAFQAACRPYVEMARKYHEEQKAARTSALAAMSEAKKEAALS